MKKCMFLMTVLATVLAGAAFATTTEYTKLLNPVIGQPKMGDDGYAYCTAMVQEKATGRAYCTAMVQEK